MSDFLHVQINSPEKIIWEGEAKSVSSVNTAGPFDILPMHANFITILEKREIVVRDEKGEQKYTFDRSVIYAHSNNVFVYTNI